MDLCAEVVCGPQGVCEGEVLVESLEEGVCEVESGQCRYDNQEARETDCRGEFDFACVEGACVCLAEEHQSDDLNCGCEGPCADDYTCVEGSCEAPPLETCQGDVCVATTVLVPAGPFIMGPHDNTPQQEVTLTRSYLIQRTEVTQGQYEDLMGDNPSWFGPNGIGDDCGSDCLVEEVSWFDAVAYCNALSMRDGFQPCHDAEGNLIGGETVYACEGWRLPTHAEWEKAARGTDGRTYPWGEDRPSCSLAIISNGCFRESTWPVASRDQGVSPYVLYDMTGNVSEWTWDGDYEFGQLGTDPVGDTGGACRGSRGGSYYNGAFGNPKNVEIARRSCSLTSGSRTRGFRCVRSN